MKSATPAGVGGCSTLGRARFPFARDARWNGMPAERVSMRRVREILRLKYEAG